MSLGTRSPVLKRRPGIRVFALALVGLTLGYGLYLAVDVASRLPDPRALSSLERMPEATVIYDAFGRPIFTIFREQRVRVPLERLSPHLLDAVLAIEDRRFHRHRGIDPVRVAGAAAANLTAGRIVQGGSTITQQLARQSLLSSEKTFGRKLAEIVTALRIEHAYTKREILELYLNRIYFGSGFYGAEAAARGYFGKPAAELGLSEAALLAGLIQAPERHSPRASPQRAIARRNLVLRAMLATGVIDAPAYEQACRDPLIVNNGLQAAERSGGYFKEEVRRRLIDMFGWEAVYERGLRVYSTIDPAMQRAADEALERGVRRIEARPAFRHPRRGGGGARPTAGEPDYLQGALIALDPRSGEVRALVGGRDFAVSSFNRATQAFRQPGSAFKPILYAAALDQGLTPVTVLDDLDHPVSAAEGDWLPADGNDEVSALTVRAALQVSSNRAAVKLLALTGIDRTVDYAARFGLGRQPRVPSVALGSGSVTLEALTAAYAAFANQGTVPEPTYLTRVTDAGGRVLFEANAQGARVRPPAVNPATAFIVADLLRGVVDAGTGAGVRRQGFAAPAAGKTGTTDDYKDAWFIGFTPDLAAGVWIGFDAPRTIMRRGYASDVAAPVWASFMTRAVGSGRAAGWIAPPPDVVPVEICVLSGRVATDACRQQDGDVQGGIRRPPTYVEFFAAGTEPVGRCPLHGLRPLLALLAAPFRRLSGPDPLLPPPPPPEPAGPTGRMVEAARPSVAVVHNHVFGSCAGRLIAGPDGLRYVTAHRDAFAIGFADLLRVRVDTKTQRLWMTTRRGRAYTFGAAAADLDALAAFEAAVGVK